MNKLVIFLLLVIQSANLNLVAEQEGDGFAITAHHFFEFPPTPTNESKVASDDAQLLAILRQPKAHLIIAALKNYVREHGDSRWNAGVLHNIGLYSRRTGAFSEALNSWRQAWTILENTKNPKCKPLADAVFAELTQMNAWLGRYNELEKLLGTVRNREFTGGATELVASATQALSIMRDHPDKAFRCGPYAISVLSEVTGKPLPLKTVRSSISTTNGLSLNALETLSREWNIQMVAVKWRNDHYVPTNAVVHWKVNHYAAIVGKTAQGFIIKDKTFAPIYGRELIMSDEVVKTEASGYFLLPADSPQMSLFSKISNEEAQSVFGKGETTASDYDAFSSYDLKTCDNSQAQGLAKYSIHLMLVSLNIVDTPLFYNTLKGNDFNFTLTYNQRDPFYISPYRYANVGPKWSFNWATYISSPNSGGTPNSIKRYLPGGGAVYHTLIPGTSDYQDLFGNILTRNSGTDFTLKTPGGEQVRFAYSVSELFGTSYLVWPTEFVDQVGNRYTLSYQTTSTLNRLSTITDPTGKTITFLYENSFFPNAITRVQGPYGRETVLTYDLQGRLQTIKDMIGMSSSFAYKGSSDFVESMTTPYGTTHFEAGERPQNLERWLVATDPLGNKEKVLFKHQAPTPSDYRTTFYWGKKAYADANLSDDYSKAHAYTWLHNTIDTQTSRVVESEKPPLSGRISYWYPGQQDASFAAGISLMLPSITTRSVEDENGTLQTVSTSTQYNECGRITNFVDEKGRETKIDYINSVDMIKISRKNGTTWEILMQLKDYINHRPQTIINQCGQSTLLEWNLYGQLTKVTKPNGAVVNYVYDPTSFKLLYKETVSMEGTRKIEYSYDSQDRVYKMWETADANYYEFTFDGLDRITQLKYPDNSFFQLFYDRMDVIRYKDRAGRYSTFSYDIVGNLVRTKDPAGAITGYAWCGCGLLESISVDPDGLNQVTSFIYDTQSRLKQRVFADNSSREQYDYYSQGGALKTITDAKGQINTLYYYTDGSVAKSVFSGSVTPTVTYQYDPIYSRLTQMQDGQGITSFAYKAIPTFSNPATSQEKANALGAGLLQSIDGPFSNDTITLTYDNLSRVTGVQLNGQNDTVSFDGLGRVATEINSLGSFSWQYEGTSRRVDTIKLGTQILADYSYYGNEYVRRISAVQHYTPSGTQASHFFDIKYDGNSFLKAWNLTDLADNTVQTYNTVLDGSDQILSYEKIINGNITHAEVFRYDKAGNRVAHQVDSGPGAPIQSLKTVYKPNKLDQIDQVSLNNKVFLKGMINEAATVTIDSVAVGTVPTGNGSEISFDGEDAVNTLNYTFNLSASDFGVGSGNTTTKTYSGSIAAYTTRSFSYDLNGNTLAPSGKTYEFDAQDRLVKVIDGTITTTIYYDGFSRRSRVVEQNGTTVTKDQRFVWLGGSLLGVFDQNGAIVTRYFSKGVEQFVSGTSSKYIYTFDLSGNVKEVHQPNGTLVARYEYDLFGNRTRVSGSFESDLSFGGLYKSGINNLLLATFRAYDAETGRWLTRDPMGERFDRNLYRFNYNNPVNFVDPNGLWGMQFGDFNIGYGDPNLAFDNDSWMDLSNGAAATADGLIPFGDPFADLYQNGGIWSDDNVGFSDYDRSLYEKSKAGGKVAQVCLTTAAGLGATRALNGFFMPKTLYHFTSAEGAAGIYATGGIQAGSGLYGTGVYLTGFNSATMATIQGAASTEVAIAVSSQGLAISPTFFPGTYILRGASLLLP